MYKVTQILKALVGTFRPTSAINATTTAAAPAPIPVEDDIQFCHRHGDAKPRRRLKDSGVSAHGSHFVVFECPVCAAFVARATDRATSRPFILFRGKYYNPRRQGQQRTPFRSVRAGHATA